MRGVIEKNRDKYLDELFDWLRCKSISTTNEGIRECCECVRQSMERCGIETKIFETEKNPILYGEYIVDRRLPTMLVYGHYDVQPPEPYELWESDPFEPVIRNERIYARGVSDNKGQLLTYLKGMEVYKAVYGDLPVNLKFLIEGEEEIGSPSLDGFVSDHRELLSCDLAVLSDSCIHESGTPLVALGLKGMVFAEIELHGANSDMHSMRAAAVPSPLWRMVGLLNSIKGEDGLVKIDGFYDNVRQPEKEEREAVERLPYDKQEMLETLGVEGFLKGRYGDDYYYNVIFEPTCNIAGLYGGYTGEGSKTVLPNKATVKIDMRLVPNQSPEEIRDKLMNHLAQNGYGDAKVTFYSGITPSRTPMKSRYLKPIVEAVTEAWEKQPFVYPGLGGAGPNYVFTDTLGVPCYMVPFSYSDHNNHAPNENMRLDGFFRGIHTVASLIKRLGNR